MTTRGDESAKANDQDLREGLKNDVVASFKLDENDTRLTDLRKSKLHGLKLNEDKRPERLASTDPSLRTLQAELRDHQADSFKDEEGVAFDSSLRKVSALREFSDERSKRLPSKPPPVDKT